MSPHDPHLIAPAVPSAPSSPVFKTCCSNEDDVNAAGGLIAAARLLAPLRPSGAAENGAGWRQELSALGEQLRTAAASWQGLAAAVASVEGRSAAQAGQLAGLSSGVADLRAAQGRLEQAAAQQRLEVQGRLAELGGRLDVLTASTSSPSATRPGSTALVATEREVTLSALTARLAEVEAAVSGLQANVKLAAALPPAGNAGQASSELATLQAQLSEVRQAQDSALQRQEEHAAQKALLGRQLDELAGVQRDTMQRMSTRIEQLAQQLTGLGSRGDEQRQQQHEVPAGGSEQRQRAQAAPSADASLQRLEQLAGQVAMVAAALQSLQSEVGDSLQGWQAGGQPPGAGMMSWGAACCPCSLQLCKTSRFCLNRAFAHS